MSDKETELERLHSDMDETIRSSDKRWRIMSAEIESLRAKVAELERDKGAARRDSTRSHNIVAAFQKETAEARRLIERAYKLIGGQSEGDT